LIFVEQVVHGPISMSGQTGIFYLRRVEQNSNLILGSRLVKTSKKHT
jgi:hypothetical protein